MKTVDLCILSCFISVNVSLEVCSFNGVQTKTLGCSRKKSGCLGIYEKRNMNVPSQINLEKGKVKLQI